MVGDGVAGRQSGRFGSALASNSRVIVTCMQSVYFESIPIKVQVQHVMKHAIRMRTLHSSSLHEMAEQFVD
jgi:hypothetical protein